MTAITQPFESAEMRAVISERDQLLREQDGVTVCVPCYQQAEYLHACLASLEAQTVPPLEVIVIDDGTPDDSVMEVVLRHGPETGVHYIRVTNRGLPNARNVGLMLARGRAFLPLDADDWVSPDFIEKTMPLLADADVVVTGLQEHGPRSGAYLPGWDRELVDISEELLWQSNRLFYCALYDTRYLRNLGGWNGRMIHGWEDWDLWLDIYRRGGRIAEVRECLFQYRTKEQSMLHEAERWRDWNRDEMRRHHLG